MITECTSDATWVDQVPGWTCERVTCGQVPLLPHGKITAGEKPPGGEYLYEDRLTFTCDRGYDAVNKTTTTTCQVSVSCSRLRTATKW